MSAKQLELVISKRPIEFMGRRQRVYIQESVPAQQKHIPQQKKETVLQKVELPTGFYETLVERDYPINSETVSSYADTADYRSDPLGAIASAPKRVNLGDISGVQEFMNGDPQRAVTVYKEVLAQVQKVLNTVAEPKPEINPQNTVKEGEE